MRNLLVSALAVGVLIVPISQVVNPSANRRAQHDKVKGTDETVQHEQSPESEAIEKAIQIQQQNIQLLHAEETHAAAQIEEDARLVRYTKYLVWIGALQGAVFFFTLLAIGHEATIATKIAGAASANAKAVTRSERAWILVKPDLPDKLRLDDPDVFLTFTWSIKNVGRTPARLVETYATALRVKDIKAILPSPEYQAKPQPMNNFLLVPNDSVGLAWLVEPLGEPFTLEEINDIKRHKLTLLAYGFVRYLDIFGNEHTTRFCHRYMVRDSGGEGFEAYFGAPPEYNRCD
jgi:hypothetical protein